MEYGAQRIELLLDEDSFEELDKLVAHRCRDFGMDEQIVPGDGGYDYAARYTAGKTEFYVPARLPGEVAAQVARIAITAHSVLGLRDLSRTDLIVDEAGTAYFLEVNVSPGMTETSTLPMALEASGHAFGTTCVRLLELAAARGA